MGLCKVMGFRHNWNESIIRQFYATLEVDMEDECLTWMTGKKSFVASFQDFASLIGLDYEEMKTGKTEFNYSLHPKSRSQNYQI